jgi:hypothetical protein
VADCRALGAAEPTVEVIDEKIVKVTIFARSRELTEDRGRRGPASSVQVADRITVALIPKVAQELITLQDRSSLSKTDIINRAITLYEFIDSQTSEGGELILRDKSTGKTQVVRLL